MVSRWSVVVLALCAVVMYDAFFVINEKVERDGLKAEFMRDIDLFPKGRSDLDTSDAYTVFEKDNDRPRKHPTRRGATEMLEELNMMKNPVQEEKKEIPEQDRNHRVAGLSCRAHGGPSDLLAAEMVYWRDIPSDATYKSPFFEQNTEQNPKYLTFEPDEGGWNNIRMSMETAVAMAHAMGRTLVMPPEQGMYLINKESNNQKSRFTFTDFFHFDSVTAEHAGVRVISFQEFLEREVMPDHKGVYNATGHRVYPHENRTNWNGVSRFAAKLSLDRWMRSFTAHPKWSFDDCMVAIPSKPQSNTDHFLEWEKKALETKPKQQNEYFGRPVAVDAEPLERLSEYLGHRKGLCVYDKKHQESKVLHLVGDNQSGARLLVHFYAFLFFEDWKQDLWTKRFVRDHLRYVDEIQCAAARVVASLRRIAKRNGDFQGHFDTMHVRRGDFQYKDTRVEAQDIFANSQDVLKPNSTLFIATDEKNKRFFQVFRKHYHVYFLDDFVSYELAGINTNFYGMIDQRIASRGRVFVGCYYSTFTGYINRMRGYHAQKDRSVRGWQEQGAIDSYYYIPVRNKLVMREYRPITPPMWAREFPLGWRDINKGIEEIRKITSTG